jgi:ribosomal protein L32
MAVPKRKVSRSRRDSRSANKHLNPKSNIFCKNESCKAPILQHTVCCLCGQYKGIQVLKIKNKKNKNQQAADPSDTVKKTNVE